MMGWRTGGDLFSRSSISVETPAVNLPSTISIDSFVLTVSLDGTKVFRRVYWSALHQGLKLAIFYDVHVPANRLLGVPIPNCCLNDAAFVLLSHFDVFGNRDGNGPREQQLLRLGLKGLSFLLLQSVTAMRSSSDWCTGDKVG